MTITNNDIDHGYAANGSEIGSGYDVEIKRESATSAIANVIELSTKREWLGAQDVTQEQDLQALAVEIGQCPGIWIGDMAANDTDEWDGLADRWDAIEISRTSVNEVECECGKVTGERCQWTGPKSETVVVEYMPDYLRASHEAAGNRGVYPANGAIRIRCEKGCADLIVKTEDGWAEILQAKHG